MLSYLNSLPRQCFYIHTESLPLRFNPKKDGPYTAWWATHCVNNSKNFNSFRQTRSLFLSCLPSNHVLLNNPNALSSKECLMTHQNLTETQLPFKYQLDAWNKTLEFAYCVLLHSQFCECFPQLFCLVSAFSNISSLYIWFRANSPRKTCQTSLAVPQLTSENLQFPPHILCVLGIVFSPRRPSLGFHTDPQGRKMVYCVY